MIPSVAANKISSYAMLQDYIYISNHKNNNKKKTSFYVEQKKIDRKQMN